MRPSSIFIRPLAVPLAVQNCVNVAFNEMPALQQLNMCRESYETREQAMILWDLTGAGRVLDCIVESHSKDDAGTGWFQEALRAGGLGGGGMDCSTFTGAGCEIAPDDCEDLIKEGKGSIYWILKAVSIMNLWFTDIHEGWVQDSQAAKIMDVYEIEKHFGPPREDELEGKRKVANDVGLGSLLPLLLLVFWVRFRGLG